MRQRLRELNCVILGHHWFFFGYGVYSDRSTPLTHKSCWRCHRTEFRP